MFNFNAVTGKPYQNNNQMLLTLADKGKQWAGFHQWLSVGRSVRKGEKGTPIVMIMSKTLEDGTVKTFPRGGTVFELSQTDPIEGKEQGKIWAEPDLTEQEIIATIMAA